MSASRKRHTFYVILSDWEDVLRQVIAWTENPYVAITYFREYRKLDSDSEMVTIECDSHFALASILNENYATDVQNVLESQLMTKTSRDERCYVIYASRYKDFFSDHFLQNMKITTQVCDTISHIMLNIAPLMKFLNEPECTDIINVTYNVYGYTSIRKMLQEGPKATPIWELIDIVYFWRFVNTVHPNILNGWGKEAQFLPVEAIFIDSN